MNAWWQMWVGHLDALTCESIIAQAKALPELDGAIGHGGATKTDDMRRSKIRWVLPTNQVFASYFRIIEDLFQQANASAFGFDLTYIRSAQFTEYESSYGGHYDWHEDLTWDNPKTCHRKLSMVIQLSDPQNYSGGDLLLEHQTPKVMDLRTRGTVIVFPSFCKHKIEPITTGIRNSLVVWYEGPKFR